MKKTIKTPLATAIGTAVVATFTTSAVNAEANPFAMSELSDGYMQIAQSDSPASFTVKPWGGKKANEASCGEGKCGAMMDGDKMKKGMENSCGAMMKGKEGACGEMDKNKDKNSGMDGMKGGDMSCGAMMKNMGDMKGGDMSCGAMMNQMKGGEMSCGSKVDPAKASGK